MDMFWQICMVVHAVGFLIALAFPTPGFAICALAIRGVGRYRPLAVRNR